MNVKHSVGKFYLFYRGVLGLFFLMLAGVSSAVACSDFCPLITQDREWTLSGETFNIFSQGDNPPAPYTHINLQRRLEGGTWKRIKLWEGPNNMISQQITQAGNHEYRARLETRVNGTLTAAGQWCPTLGHEVKVIPPGPTDISYFPNGQICQWQLSTTLVQGADGYIWTGDALVNGGPLVFSSYTQGPTIPFDNPGTYNMCVKANHPTGQSEDYCESITTTSFNCQ